MRDKKMNQICDECHADLSKAVELSIQMCHGILIIICPVCKYNIPAKTNDEGEIVFLNKGEPKKIGGKYVRKKSRSRSG